MPHSGQELSITGTLRGDGDVFKLDNALYTDAVPSVQNFELREDGSIELREDGTTELRE